MYDALVKDGSTLTHETVTNLEHPFLALLGPVRLLNAKGPAPLTKGKNEVSTVLMDRYAAVAAFLHLHPGVETEDYHAAFWPGSTTVPLRLTPAVTSSPVRFASGWVPPRIATRTSRARYPAATACPS